MSWTSGLSNIDCPWGQKDIFCLDRDSFASLRPILFDLFIVFFVDSQRESNILAIFEETERIKICKKRTKGPLLFCLVSSIFFYLVVVPHLFS